MIVLFRACLLGLAACILTLPVNAQHAPAVSGLAGRNAVAHQSGGAFPAYGLFNPATGIRHADIVGTETALTVDPAELARLLRLRPEGLRLALRTEAGSDYVLELLRAAPISADADFGTIDEAGRHRSGTDEGLHYQGIVAGAERSMATLSAFPNGDVMVLFSTVEGNFNLGKLEDGSGNYILYNDKDLRITPPAGCSTPDTDPLNTSRVRARMKTSRAMLCSRVRVYWEIAYNVFVAQGRNIATTRNYVSGLFNQYAAMFVNENIRMELSSMYIWVGQDHYVQTSSATGLTTFKQYWNFLGNSYNGDLAHLLTRNNNGTGGGNGGRAYLDVLCSRGFSYAYSDVYGTFRTVPTFSWDVQVITHEAGHNLGANHTHWCGWNTGAGGSCGAIDDCAALEPGSGCSTCGVTLQNSAPAAAWSGSVMSYCHTVARGINLANGFGPLPGAAIRAEVAAAACLSPLLKASLASESVCGGSGSIRVVPEPGNDGTPPYTYNWSNGGTGAVIANLKTAGSYSVVLRDSNGCTLPLAANFAPRSFPGDGVPVDPAIRMPICCGATSERLELRTTLNTVLDSCQTVYWLRTPAPVVTVAEAQAYFDTATVTLLRSKSVGVAGALLDVAPPADCAGPQTWYYTPVSATIAMPVDSFAAFSGQNVPYSVGFTQLGATVTLPDQRAALVRCDAADTLQYGAVTVAVANYFGRPGRMIITIREAAGRMLFHGGNYPGNGTYVIPADSIAGPILGAMTISVFDYNCSSASVCEPAGAVVTASRTVRYRHRRPIMNADCRIGASIETSFAPAGCTPLRSLNGLQASLVPNPATSSVILRYNALPTPLDLEFYDMLGRRLGGEKLPAGKGTQARVIDLQAWARGIYIFSLSDQTGQQQRIKLVLR